MQSVIPRPPCSISTFSDRVHLQKREQARSPTESGKELEGCLPSAAIAGICGATIVAASAVKRPSLRHRPGAWRLGLSRRVSLCASTAERQVLEEQRRRFARAHDACGSVEILTGSSAGHLRVLKLPKAPESGGR
eukprot:TRINITY_DN34322_c0_g1_i2.p3 TRINITY_DN34322_c0_g1~~TRINITY_DN34322_c0_g1_i2.p3  ORF type:complete len:135 (+),score=12.17 TRINITY_DN34322_c0_g1_i2:142-546(+)